MVSLQKPIKNKLLFRLNKTKYMKSLKEKINESLTVNESFLSVGLTIIVALLLAKFAFKGIAGIAYIWKGIKMGVEGVKEYADAINKLNQLLTPYKDELLKTEWGSRLFDENKIVTAKSIQSKGCACIYQGLRSDLEKVLSKEDYEKYMEIIEPIREIEREKMKKSLGL